MHNHDVVIPGFKKQVVMPFSILHHQATIRLLPQNKGLSFLYLPIIV